MKPVLTALTIAGILLIVVAPVPLRVVGTLFLFFVPGAAIVSFLLPQKDVVDYVILSVITGFAFQITYAYFLPLALHFSLLTLFLPSLFFSLLFDVKAKPTFTFEKKSFLIFIPAALFALATLNVHPGEDALAHVEIIGDIRETAAIPHMYALEPDIPRLIYPVGFHTLIAQIQLFSHTDNHVIFWFASFLAALLCLSIYFCTKKLFTTECGLLAGTFSIFATYLPLNSLIMSYYTGSTAYLFVCASLGTIAQLEKEVKVQEIVFLSLMLAAGVETHLSFFLIVLPISLFLLQVLVKMHRTHGYLEYGAILGGGVGLSLPFLVQFLTGRPPQNAEPFFFLWYNAVPLTRDMLFERVGIWITLLSIPGLFLLKRYRLLFGCWIGLFFFLALNTVMKIDFPLSYAFIADRMVDQLFLPFSVLAAFFLTSIWRFSKAGVVLLCGILLISGGLNLAKAPRADRGALFPTNSSFLAIDQEGMAWLAQHTEADAVILNEWWTSSGGTWIPSLARRQVVFSYLANVFSVNWYTRDDYIKGLSLVEKERKSFVIAAFPDSEEAYDYLKEMDVDYLFLSGYVLEDVKWRGALWSPSALKSPNYVLMFQEGYTFIFKVSPSFEYSHTFVLHDNSFVLKGTRDVDVSVGETSFPPERILDIHFIDSGWGEFQITAGDTILAKVSMANTKDAVHVAFRIPPDVDVLTFSSEIPVEMEVAVAAAFRNSFEVGPAALVGKSWEKTPAGYQLTGDAHMYVFHTLKTLEITYMDRGEGNVDINAFYNGEWRRLTTVYRENDGRIKTILLDIPGGYTLLDIGVKSWGDPFLVTGLKSMA